MSAASSADRQRPGATATLVVLGVNVPPARYRVGRLFGTYTLPFHAMTPFPTPKIGPRFAVGMAPLSKMGNPGRIAPSFPLTQACEAISAPSMGSAASAASGPRSIQAVPAPLRMRRRPVPVSAQTMYGPAFAAGYVTPEKFVPSA